MESNNYCTKATHGDDGDTVGLPVTEGNEVVATRVVGAFDDSSPELWAITHNDKSATTRRAMDEVEGDIVSWMLSYKHKKGGKMGESPIQRFIMIAWMTHKLLN